MAMNKNKGQLIDSEDIKINQSFDYGYAFVVMEMMDKLRINEAIEKAYRGKSALVKLMIIGKVLTRGSKLHIFNWIKRNKFIAEKLAIDTETLKVDDLYFELGELSRGQDIIERKWNLYHKFRHQDIYLYDITSTYFEGSQNELAAFGYNRDGKKGKLQITVGLITNSEGFPLKIQVFEGNVSDSKTVNGQLRTIKESFNAGRIILVGDRGMRIRLNLEEMDNEQKQDIYYISALTDSEIRALLKDQTIQLDLFAKHLVEIQDNGIRYILSCNPQLEQEKGQVRENLKQRFEDEILSLKTAWQKRRDINLKNQTKLARGHKNKKLVTCFTEKRIDSFKFRAGESLKRYKMSNFYNISISNDEFTINFLPEEYQKQKQLDGKYIIETTVQKEQMNTEQVRQEYKKLQNVEHAFRDLKTDKLNIRPVYHRNEEQTRGHVFVCMFAYAIVKEIETAIYPWLKSYNAKNKCKLSYWDIIDELKNIKMSELEIGYQMKELKIPELNPIQVQVMKILKLNPCKIIET
ncbi:MAG: IS1634 family transposase [Mariniphaga sp.]|nr:IS1634 family transposase [Mariniphaga sp.]